MAVTSRTRRTKATSAVEVQAGKLKIGMSTYDPEADRQYGGDSPVAGNYTFRLTDVRAHTSESSGKSSIHWKFVLDDKRSPYNGWPYGEQYTNLDPDGALFKTQRIVYALTGSTADLDLDLSDTAAGRKSRDKFIAAAKLVRGTVRMEPYGEEMRAKLGNVMPLDTALAAAADDDDEDDYEDDDDFEAADEYDDDEEVEEEDADEDEDDADDEDEEEDDEEDEYDEDEEEEDEPEPEPAPRRRAKAAPAKAAAAKSAPAKRAAPAKATRAAKAAPRARRAAR